MENMFNPALFITAVLIALISGLFYSYSCSVNIGLGRLADGEYLRAMQAINRAILNPWFYASFIGSAIMLPLTTWLCYREAGLSEAFYFLLAASIVYAVGVFGMTVLGNVPLNESLDRFVTDTATISEIKERRVSFELPWNRYHLIRTIANVLSLVLVVAAIFKR